MRVFLVTNNCPEHGLETGFTVPPDHLSDDEIERDLAQMRENGFTVEEVTDQVEVITLPAPELNVPDLGIKMPLPGTDFSFN